MKIVDEKGRFLGFINVVDLIIIVALVLAVCGVMWKFFSPSISEAVSHQVEMTSVMRVRGAMTFMLDEIEKNPLEGKKLVSGNEYVEASIEKVQVVPYVTQVPTADGRIVDATDPTKKDILITIKSEVSQNTPTPKIGNQEVRAGRTFTVKTQDFETIATIDSVRFK